jgi:hypothetical protein
MLPAMIQFAIGSSLMPFVVGAPSTCCRHRT